MLISLVCLLPWIEMLWRLRNRKRFQLLRDLRQKRRHGSSPSECWRLVFILHSLPLGGTCSRRGSWYLGLHFFYLGDRTWLNDNVHNVTVLILIIRTIEDMVEGDISKWSELVGEPKKIQLKGRNTLFPSTREPETKTYLNIVWKVVVRLHFELLVDARNLDKELLHESC